MYLFQGFCYVKAHFTKGRKYEVTLYTLFYNFLKNPLISFHFLLDSGCWIGRNDLFCVWCKFISGCMHQKDTVRVHSNGLYFQFGDKEMKAQMMPQSSLLWMIYWKHWGQVRISLSEKKITRLSRFKSETHLCQCVLAQVGHVCKHATLLLRDHCFRCKINSWRISQKFSLNEIGNSLLIQNSLALISTYYYYHYHYYYL